MIPKIDKNVKKPDSGRKYGVAKYRFWLMEVGDSIFAPVKSHNTLISAASQWRRKFNKEGIKFECFPWKEGEIEGFRIFRVK